MPATTDFLKYRGPTFAFDHMPHGQGAPIDVAPVVERVTRTTNSLEQELLIDTGPEKFETQRQRFSAPLSGRGAFREVIANSAPMAIWEGTVTDIDTANGVMQVLLEAKMGHMPRHSAEIELDWVSDQDRDLVVRGAVFYLTLFKRSKPSIENAQELRFRRRPAWSKSQVTQIKRDAELLGSKLRPLPIAK